MCTIPANEADEVDLSQDWICFDCGEKNLGDIRYCISCGNEYKASSDTIALLPIGRSHIRAMACLSKFDNKHSPYYVNISQVKKQEPGSQAAPVQSISVSNPGVWDSLTAAVEGELFRKIGWKSERRALLSAQEGVKKSALGNVLAQNPEVLLELNTLIDQGLKRVEPAKAKDAAQALVSFVQKLSGTASDSMLELVGQAAELSSDDLADFHHHMSQWFQLRQSLGRVEALRRLSVIDRFESLIKANATKELDLHRVIEAEPWIVNDQFIMFYSNKTFKTILGTKLEDKDMKQYELARPDLAGLEDGKKFVLVELKRPCVRVGEEELNQLERYLVVVGKYLPGYESIRGYLVGDEQSDLLTNHLQHRSTIDFLTYWDLVKNVRERCQAFIEATASD